jgi:hypothetical protein
MVLHGFPPDCDVDGCNLCNRFFAWVQLLVFSWIVAALNYSALVAVVKTLPFDF